MSECYLWPEQRDRRLGVAGSGGGFGFSRVLFAAGLSYCRLVPCRLPQGVPESVSLYIRPRNVGKEINTSPQWPNMAPIETHPRDYGNFVREVMFSVWLWRVACDSGVVGASVVRLRNGTASRVLKVVWCRSREHGDL